MKNDSPQQYRQMQYNRIKNSLKYRYEYERKKYRNLLELEVAKILTEKSVDFEYERILKCDDKFYFPDFAFDEIIIECTFWDDVERKSKGLQMKIDDYLKLGFVLVLVVTTEKYLERYSKLLTTSNVMVITADHLSDLLDGKFGRVKRV